MFSVRLLSDRPAPSEVELRAFLAQARCAGPPPIREPAPSHPTERCWAAAPSRADGASPAMVVAYHPSLSFAFEGVPEMRPLRNRPGWHSSRQGRLPSRIEGRSMRSTSSLQFDCMRWLEIDPGTWAMCERPLRLRCRVGEAWRSHVPDLLIAGKAGLECIDLAYEGNAGLRENEVRWRAVGAALAAIGIGYRVLTERHIRRQPLRGNVATVFRARHVRVPQEAAEAAALVGAMPGLSVHELMAQSGLDANQVWSLVRQGLLAVDLEAAPLGPATRVSLRLSPGQRFGMGAVACRFGS